MSKDNLMIRHMDTCIRPLNADDRDLKIQLVRQVSARLHAEGLTQIAAAERLGISQPDVSRLLRGNVGQFSVERLMRLLVALGQDIEIRVCPASRVSGAQITVGAT
jgi:predicted XRE-type DNA-binding protein